MSVEVRITGETEEEVRVGVVVKTQGGETKGLGRCRHTRFMTREVVFYTKILPAIIRSIGDGSIRDGESLERFLPKCYYGHASQSASCHKLLSCCLPWPADSRTVEEGGMLVLEDLTRTRGAPAVSGVDKNALMTFAHLEAALRSLAHFHGAAWQWTHFSKQESQR